MLYFCFRIKYIDREFNNSFYAKNEAEARSIGEHHYGGPCTTETCTCNKFLKELVYRHDGQKKLPA